MPRTPERRFLDRWMWERPARRVAWLLFVVPLVVGGILCLFTGSRALIVGILVSLFGLFNLFADAPIGKRMERLRASWPPEAPEPVDCLIVNGFLQSPGLAAFVEGRVELWPILGSKVTIALESIEAIRETPIFNGSLLLGKTGFWLIIPGRARLGFAVPSSTAQQWRKRLYAPPSEGPGTGIPNTGSYGRNGNDGEL